MKTNLSIAIILFAGLLLTASVQTASAQVPVSDNWYKDRTVYKVDYATLFPQQKCEIGSVSCIEGKQQETAAALGITGAVYWNELTRGLAEKLTLKADDLVAYDSRSDLTHVWRPNCRICKWENEQCTWVARPNRMTRPPQPAPPVATVSPTPPPPPYIPPPPQPITNTNTLGQQQAVNVYNNIEILMPAPVAQKGGGHGFNPCRRTSRLKAGIGGAVIGSLLGGGLAAATDHDVALGFGLGTAFGGGAGAATKSICAGVAGAAASFFPEDEENPVVVTTTTKSDAPPGTIVVTPTGQVITPSKRKGL